MGLSLGQARVIDPILSTVVQGYKRPDNVGLFLFPRVPVAVAAGKVIEFDKSAFRIYSTARAPGTAFKRVQLGYQGRPFALENHGIETVIPREHLRDAAAVPGIDLASRSLNLNMGISELRLEYDQSVLARNALNYPAVNSIVLSGTSQWSDFTNSNPVADIKNGKEAIRLQTGIYPNIIEIPALVMSVLTEHPKILDKIKYTQTGVVTADLLAVLFEVEKVVVGKAIGFDDTGASIDFWGKDVILAYVPQTSTTQEEPSFGYTYTLDGNPLVEVPYWEDQTKSWVYGVGYERAPVISGIASGYIIKSAVA
jgi:hypothetical protein